MNSPPSDCTEDVYPEPLGTAESGKVNQRRHYNGLHPDLPKVGFALSGGGIRSATFCLGLFQSLAARNLIRRIDFLSTVSGGGYFGSFLGAAFSRPGANADQVEKELADNHSWSVQWLRQNGRFLSPNGAGDSWIGIGVMMRNWLALHIVLLTFGFFLLGFGILVRTDLWTFPTTSKIWSQLEGFLWKHSFLGFWGSPWLILPLVPLVAVMVPSGAVYWLTQFAPLMGITRRIFAVFKREYRKMEDREFASRAQTWLTYAFVSGLVVTLWLLVFATADSLGQTVYVNWSLGNFKFPSIWAFLTAIGVSSYAFASQAFMLVEKFLGKRQLKLTLNVIALSLSLLWIALIVVSLSVVACGFAWSWDLVWDETGRQPMVGGWKLMYAVALSFGLSWWFSRCFSFVNLSSMQQIYAARIRRAYIGATNPHRREQHNFSMTDLLPGDDFALEQYEPHIHGGPLHLVNVTVNETLSGKTQIERVDRKGLAMSIGPCGLSVGAAGHAVWAPDPEIAKKRRLLQALWDERARKIVPIQTKDGCPFNPLLADKHDPSTRSAIPGTSVGLQNLASEFQKTEAISLGRWVAISGAAFSTGLGAGTQLGLCLLLGLANVRLGYWWDSGVDPRDRSKKTRPSFIELAGRIISRVLPVQSCLMNELFARFHGPARRYWYLSDGGHFENTGCYELIRRRLPLIICSDAGQDPNYQFGDLANLVRKARTDFGAEIEIIRHTSESGKDEPAAAYPLPKIEEFVHPCIQEIIGSPEDFVALHDSDEGAPEGERAGPARRSRNSRRHALLARIRYLDTNEICWLLVVKPSLMGDEAVDVTQYQRTHPLFPQEPTSDQYFDEAQWESYRKLGEHIGTTLFSRPAKPEQGWTPASFAPPVFARTNVPAREEIEYSAERSPVSVSPSG